MNDRFATEVTLLKELVDLMESAEALRKRYVAAGMLVPCQLERLFGGDGTALTIAGDEPPKGPPRPEAAAPDWIWVPVDSLGAQSLTLAVLRKVGAPLRPSALHDQVTEYDEKMVPGTVYNIGPRLDGTIIERGQDGWSLIDPASAPFIHQGFAWGPVSVFNKQEVAAHRREIILQLIDESPGGLMSSQILKALDGKFPEGVRVEKDTIKADMIALLGDGKVKRFGSKRTWKLADTK